MIQLGGLVGVALLALLTIGFIFGAYFTEVLRGAFLAVPEGQREAGLAYGKGPDQAGAPAEAPAAPMAAGSPTLMPFR